ncbi:MAG: transcriptional regulator [Acidimicrobiales bacterium]|nr:MAG: transcriptional regulator [Acidimicrobiales bacterium]
MHGWLACGAGWWRQRCLPQSERGPAVAKDVDSVFAVLADPTRRRLLDQISREGPLTATQLAEEYPMTRQAIAKHLSGLAGAGLLTGERQGREVRYKVVADGLGGAVTWLAEVGARWDVRLAALRRQLSEPGADT